MTHYQSQLDNHENLVRAYFIPLAAAIKTGNLELIKFYQLRFLYHRRLRDLFRKLIG